MGILSNILGISGAFDPFFTVTNSVLLVILSALFLSYVLKKAKIVPVIAYMAITTQCFISIDIVYSALVPMLKDCTMVILINMLILTVNMMFSLATYQTRITQILAAIALLAYTISVLVTGDESLRNYFFMMLLILLFISVLSFRIAKNGEHLVNVNKTLRRDEEELLQVLRINKKQVKAYVALAKERHEVGQTTELLDILGEKSQKNVINNVIEYMRAKDLEMHRIEEVFPELTPTEKEICYFILRDKKLSEICALLNKTESNITTHRANIRKKLGMKPMQNLQDILLERMKASKAKGIS